MRVKKDQNIKLESVKDKSTLVKLLAEEDVNVSYQKAETASFNPNTREVVLPIWKDKSEGVMDMMSLHEVGHALYTPVSLLEDSQKKNVKHSFINVLEDVRIEKMIQNKYLGSKKVFKKAYTELLKKDFFNINDIWNFKIKNHLFPPRFDLSLDFLMNNFFPTYKKVYQND